MRKQTVTAKVYTTEVAYELPDGTQQVTKMFGKYNANRARAVIERYVGSQVLIKSVTHHWDILVRPRYRTTFQTCFRYLKRI